VIHKGRDRVDLDNQIRRVPALLPQKDQKGGATVPLLSKVVVPLPAEKGGANDVLSPHYEPPLPLSSIEGA